MKMRSLTILFCFLASTHLFAKDGIYLVPTNIDELAPFSMADIRNIKIKKEGEAFSIRYDLPFELTGSKKERFFFEGTLENGQDDIIMKNQDGHARCSTSVQDFPSLRTELISNPENISNICEIVYSRPLENRLTDRQGIIARELSTRFQGQELEARLELARRFSGDPVGLVVTFKD
jgi:hypothetical protein